MKGWLGRSALATSRYMRSSGSACRSVPSIDLANSWRGVITRTDLGRRARRTSTIWWVFPVPIAPAPHELSP